MADYQIIPSIPLYQALDRGYFQAYGLDVELTKFSQTADEVPAVATNQIQFAQLGPDPALFNAMQRGIQITMLGSGAVLKRGDKSSGMVVRQDLIDSGRYRTPKDLKGLKIAYPSQQARFYVERVLNDAGLTVDDVDLVILALPDQIAAFQSKSLDVGHTVEPLITTIKEQGLGTLLIDAGQEYAGGIPVILMVNPDFQNNNAEVVRRYVDAWLHGLRDFYYAFNKGQADKAPLVAALANHTPLKDPTMYAKIGMHYVDPNGPLDVKVLDTYQDYFIDKLQVQQTKLDLTKYIDLGPMNEAVQRQGRIVE